MKTFVATFHTHLAALVTDRNLREDGNESRMIPVPRNLSASCGTCVMYRSDGIKEELMDSDTEAIYEMTGKDEYRKIKTYE